MTQRERDILSCPCCGWEIDPEMCWCGDGKASHAEHTFVPMGCTCGYHDAETRKNPDKK